MNFDDLLRYKTLDRKFVASGSNLMELVASEAIENNVPMKNVCALIHQELFDDLTSTCALLDISKRTFIEGAIIDALKKAEAIMASEGLHEALHDRSLRLVEEES